ncbi:hypothetical protein [Bacillus sp. SG-1]|uniref:hypothetical protein n=1 Tax=Bacillus sp. SG-1 TaxID=161544 RepID=UPI0001543A5F|nr:hypothetical protein [Bacillus sp. SG-1]EDL65675.1 hypothetical protein BSG1_12411 [Bacillus sp. SG-1]
MIRVCVLLILLLLLSGCRVEWSLSGDSAGKTAVSTNAEPRPTNTGNDPVSVLLNGDVDYEGTHITLMGYPELHQGSVLKVQLRNIPRMHP